MKKYFFILIANLAHTNFVFAQTVDDGLRSKIINQQSAFRESSGLAYATSSSASQIISSIIKIFLGFLGIIFIVLVIWAGYNWMTAGGNEEKITKAKKTLYQAIIGLLITVSAYAITYFVFSALDKSTSTL